MTSINSQKRYTALFEKQKAFFATQETKTYAFRKEQLELLRTVIQNNEAVISEALLADLGKPPFESYASEIGFVLAEISETLKHLKKWMRPKRKRSGIINFPSKSLLYKEPKGTVLIIGPWNYPFQLIFAPLIASMAAGNTSILKPAEQTPRTAAVIEEIIKGTFDEAYISVVQGEGHKVVPALMEHHRFDHVFFTGSTTVGRKIAEMAAKKLTPCTLELGGKSPAIIDKSAKLDVAVKRIAFGKWLNAGQTCVAPDYVLVHESIKTAFVTKLIDTIKAFYGKDPLKSKDYANIINASRFEILTNFLKEVEIAYGGNWDKSELRIEPTILTLETLENPLMREEIFGPILPILSFGHIDEAIEIVSANPNPLALYLFTNDRHTEERVVGEIPFGGGMVNNTIVHLTNMHLPFGGIGESGWGNYHGLYGFNTFSHFKSIMKTRTWFDLKQKYPPYSQRMYRLLKWFMR
jgi:aldehyde dehydrogenase (NAD+)